MSSHKDILQSMICYSEVTPPEWLCINKRLSPDQPQIIVTHIGVKQSLRRVFGSSWLKALLPIFTRWGSTRVAEGRPEFMHSWSRLMPPFSPSPPHTVRVMEHPPIPGKGIPFQHWLCCHLLALREGWLSLLLQHTLTDGDGTLLYSLRGPHWLIS